MQQFLFYPTFLHYFFNKFHNNFYGVIFDIITFFYDEYMGCKERNFKIYPKAKYSLIQH